MLRFVNTVVALTWLALSAGCSSVPVDQRATMRDQIVESSEEIKALFVAEIPGLEQELTKAAGFFTARISGGKVVLGGANGIGVLFDNAGNRRTFMNATRVDLGVALGAGTDRSSRGATTSNPNCRSPAHTGSR